MSLEGRKTLWEKEKMMVTIVFSFSHEVSSVLFIQVMKIPIVLL